VKVLIIHHTYRSNFITVDVHNKLSVGPLSVCNVAMASLDMEVLHHIFGSERTAVHASFGEIGFCVGHLSACWLGRAAAVSGLA
jgi:hypothetical protein